MRRQRQDSVTAVYLSRDRHVPSAAADFDCEVRSMQMALTARVSLRHSSADGPSDSPRYRPRTPMPIRNRATSRKSVDSVASDPLAFVVRSAMDHGAVFDVQPEQ